MRSSTGTTWVYSSSVSRPRANEGFQATFDLTEFTDVDYYILAYEEVLPAGQTTAPYLGAYTMTLSNNLAKSQSALISKTEIEELTESIVSPVNSFNPFAQYVPNLVAGSWYQDQYGPIGQHDPEEFFRRLFENKYEQSPSPVQTTQRSGVG